MIGFADFMAARTNPKGTDIAVLRRTVPALCWQTAAQIRWDVIIASTCAAELHGQAAVANWKVTG
jgi:hypothetical protein